jgi:hypothetical protein
MKEAEEFAGTHVLSMVRAHFPLIDFTRFTKGYPKEVGVQEAGELQGQLSKPAATIIGDINLCGTPTPPSQGVLTTWDCGLDQPIPWRAIVKQGAVGACDHDQPNFSSPSVTSRGSITTVE